MESEVRDNKVVVRHDGVEVVLEIWEAHQAAIQMLRAINEAENVVVTRKEVKR